jgi:hypothetical protein
LLGEDLNHGQAIDGLTIENAFRETQPSDFPLPAARKCPG